MEKSETVGLRALLRTERKLWEWEILAFLEMCEMNLCLCTQSCLYRMIVGNRRISGYYLRFGHNNVLSAIWKSGHIDWLSWLCDWVHSKLYTLHYHKIGMKLRRLQNICIKRSQRDNFSLETSKLKCLDGRAKFKKWEPDKQRWSINGLRIDR